MSPPNLPRPFVGIIPPLATPLLAEDRLDHAGLERLVAHVLAGGVHGLFLLGSTGEGPSLSYALRRELVERVSELVGGRVPLLVGITDTSFQEAVQMAEWAQECDAAAVVVAPPCYFVPSQHELTGYMQRLAATVELPVYLYNMPGLTKVAIDLDTVAQLLDVPNIVGLKDSSAQMLYFHKVRQLVARRPDFTLLMGPEELTAEAVLLGGHGGICGGANLAPRLYVDLFDAARAGDLPRVRTLHDRVIRLSSLLYSIGPASSSYLRGLKTALHCVGLCDDYLAEPYRRFNDAERALLRARLDELGLTHGATTPSSVSRIS
ncbi:MAG: dihydrodipicolinate synthase family protein [Gemmataceae bacterium]